jgi:predicted peptidase
MRIPFGSLALAVMAMASGADAAVTVETGFLDRSVTVDGVSHRYQVYVPIDYRPDKSWPVALFLHGSGERGDDGAKQTQVGIGSAIRADRARFPMIVVMPQARADTHWTGAMAAQAVSALDQSMAEFNGDPQRVYLTGMSRGGQGVWLVAAANPGKFAAIAPICGYLRLKTPADIPEPDYDQALLAQFPELAGESDVAAFASRFGKTPAWIFHGSADDIVSPDYSRRMHQALRGNGGDVRYTEYEGVNHGSWDRAYAEPELVPWLLSHRLGE